MAMTTLHGGIYPPSPTFFDAAGELDLATLATHVTWLMGHSLPGLLALGSNGEALHLDDGERVAVIRATRAAMDAQPRPGVLLAGTADQTTRGTIARCRA
ncbi:MAG: dihydrodipicolinate synthase family protein, partial [Ktedonobacterales bacterium]|nr:dihydrodipicolinate synthase family protein [Ktedonobacterales bacterium]